MTDSPTRAATPFPEELLSGYLDGALTQQEEQKVRLHLESSPQARTLLAELAALRQASRATPFPGGEDRQWSEAARSPVSALARRVGFTLLVLCLVLWFGGAAVIATWEGSRQSLTWLGRAVVVAGIGGAVLLFLSVLADRLRDARGDRYRRVLK